MHITVNVRYSVVIQICNNINDNNKMENLKFDPLMWRGMSNMSTSISRRYQNLEDMIFVQQDNISRSIINNNLTYYYSV